MAVQNKLITWLFDPLARLTGRWSDSVRKGMIAFSVLGIISAQFLRQAGVCDRYLIVLAVECFAMGLMILAGITTNMKPVKLSKPLLIFWYGTGVFMLISGVLVEPNHLGDAALWLVAWPVLWTVWAMNPKKSVFYRGISWGLYASLVVFMVVSKLWFPIKDLGYSSFMGNPNPLSLYCVAVLAFAASDVFSSNDITLRRCAGVLACGITFGLVIFTNSRTGLVGAAMALLTSFVISVVRDHKHVVKIIIYRLLPTVLCCFAISVSISAILAPVEHKKPASAVENPAEAAGNPAETAENPTEVYDENAPTEPVHKRPSYMDAIKYNEDRFGEQDRNLNSYMSGRTDLWKLYLKEVGFLGNPDSKVLIRPDGLEEHRSSHFTLIQMAYQNGILCAVCFLVFNILAGLKALQFAIKNKEDECAIHPLVVAIVYGGTYLMEAIYSPVYTLLCFLYIASQVSLVADSRKEIQK